MNIDDTVKTWEALKKSSESNVKSMIYKGVFIEW